MTPQIDSELVERARAGDLEAFGALIRSNYPRVAGLCARLLPNRSEAEDAAQEIFVKAHRALSSFQGNSQFSTWLYRIATNHCLDERRRSGWRHTISLDALVEQKGDSAGGALKDEGRAADRIEEAALARRLLSELPEVYREVLALRLEDLSYERIAEILECTVDAVKSRLRRGRRLMAEEMRHSNPSDSVKRAVDAGEAHES